MRIRPPMCVEFSGPAAMLVIALAASSARAEPPTYTATDITGWTPTQLATLPFFKHWIPALPATPPAPSGFFAYARTADGVFAGAAPQSAPYLSGYRATVIGPGVAISIEPYGSYSWSYWSWDGHDSHFYWGTVRDSIAYDINHAGRVVGKGTLTGSGSSSIGASYHAFVYDAAAGRVDPLPDATQAVATCINNRGQIAGYAWGSEPYWGGFRQDASGQVAMLDEIAGSACQPHWINANGWIVGACGPGPFVSRSGSETILLPKLGDFPQAVAHDINDSGWVVGFCGQYSDPETYATIWEPRPDGTWIEHDLVELLETPDVLLERARAINSRGEIIAWGHEDGSDAFGSRTYLLTPNAPPADWCVPDIGIHPADAESADGSAAFTTIVVGGSVPYEYAWQWRPDAGAAFAPVVVGLNTGAVARFVAPTVGDATLLILEAASASDIQFRCVVGNSCGQTVSEIAALIATNDCAADYNGDTTPDVLDFLDFMDDFGACEGLGAPCGSFGDADANGDTIVDVLDFLEFIDAFGGGCV